MLTPEEVRGILLPDEYIKAHGVSEYSLPEEYYYDEDGVYHYDRKFDKPMEEGGKPFNGVSFEMYEDSDQIGFYIEHKDGYYFGDYVRFYQNGALRRYTRKDAKEWYAYEWYENGVLKKMTEWDTKLRQGGPSRESEWFENGVLKKTTEWYRKGNQVLQHSKEYDENGKLIRKWSD
ncbi:MAG: hypothetical protein IJM46_14960 [Oscillospiraceae bacterium]|nr:hypothetical protein [Oscillospiraceae bacterium]